MTYDDSSIVERHAGLASAKARPEGPEMDAEYLHLGCGLQSPPGWLNVDGSWQVVLARHRWLKQLLIKLRILPASQSAAAWGTNILRLDLARPLPFSTGRFQAVYSSHTLEHLYHDDACALARECWRVLRPGGICRMVVPDVQAFVDRYVAERALGVPTAADTLMARISTHPRRIGRGPLGLYQRLTAFHNHKWMYDGASLAALFRAVGFDDVSIRGCLESAIQRIGEVEHPGRLLNGEGVAVEGRKAAQP
jgi:SAM-dependent methyltransferase